MAITSSVAAAAAAVALLQKPCAVEGREAEEEEEEKEAVVSPARRNDSREEEEECRLISYKELPDWLKDNEFIFDYYRCEWPLKQTILSIFRIHNETLEVWTHLIGFLLFFFLAAMILAHSWSSYSSIGSSSSSTVPFMAMKPNYDSSSNNFTDQIPCPLAISSAAADAAFAGASSSRPQIPASRDWYHEHMTISSANNNGVPATTTYRSSFHVHKLMQPTPALQEETTSSLPAAVTPVTRWPLLAYLLGAMFCLLGSSVCHLIFCHSERFYYYMLRLDYLGIVTLIITSFYPLVYYSFMCDPFYYRLYMAFITAFGVATVSVSLVPAFQTPAFRPVRAALFSCMGVSGLVPVMHKLIAFQHRPEAIMSMGYEALMGLSYGVGVLIYATRVPERWWPGKFDLVGHSHQLFHMFVIGGAYAHYLAGTVYLQWRDADHC